MSYSQTITGLASGSAYDFQVYAFNTAGDGPASSPPVVATTSTGVTTPTPGTVAAFIASLGVNTFMSQGYSSPSIYATMLNYLGIPNIREGETSLANFQTLLADAPGTKVNLGIGADVTGGVALAAELAGLGMLLSVEGPNEPGNEQITYNGQTGGGSGTWTPVALCQAAIYAAVTGNSATANYPVFNVSETGAETNNVGLQWTQIPSGSGLVMPDRTIYATHCNVHNYVCGTQDVYINNMAWNAADPSDAIPGIDGFYSNCMLTWGQHFAGYTPAQALVIPKVTTETGWDSVVNPGGPTVQGSQLVNTYVAQFARGWSYTFIFEMVDTQGTSSPGQGLFTTANAPKPSATYIHNMTTILKAGLATNFTPVALTYSIPSEPSTVHDMILQKNLTTYDLFVWGEQTTGSNAITVELSAQAATVNIYDVTVGTTTTQTLTSVSAVPLTLSDHLLIVEITT